jgi:hypothetical protein
MPIDLLNRGPHQAPYTVCYTSLLNALKTEAYQEVIYSPEFHQISDQKARIM